VSIENIVALIQVGADPVSVLERYIFSVTNVPRVYEDYDDKDTPQPHLRTVKCNEQVVTALLAPPPGQVLSKFSAKKIVELFENELENVKCSLPYLGCLLRAKSTVDWTKNKKLLAYIAKLERYPDDPVGLLFKEFLRTLRLGSDQAPKKPAPKKAADAVEEKAVELLGRQIIPAVEPKPETKTEAKGDAKAAPVEQPKLNVVSKPQSVGQQLILAARLKNMSLLSKALAEVKSAEIKSAESKTVESKVTETKAAEIKSGQQNITVIKSLEDTLEASDNDGRTALMWAAINGSVEMVRTLLQAGALPWIKARGWMDAVMFAAENCQADVLKILLETQQFNVNSCNQAGDSLLHLAIGSANTAVTPEQRLATVNILLAQKNINFAQKNKSGESPLQFATNRLTAVTRSLEQKSKSDESASKQKSKLDDSALMRKKKAEEAALQLQLAMKVGLTAIVESITAALSQPIREENESKAVVAVSEAESSNGKPLVASLVAGSFAKDGILKGASPASSAGAGVDVGADNIPIFRA